MIIVTRLNGTQFAINPDLLQRIDTTPDTILTLVDGTKLIVRESMAEVIELITDFRATLVVRAQDIEAQLGLHVAPDPSDDDGDVPYDHDELLPPPVRLHPRSV